MSKFHFLNVKQGDCNIIQHTSGRVTMQDICNGNAPRVSASVRTLTSLFEKASGVSGNFRMGERPTHPLDYLEDLGIHQIHRFILSHPDMDHMDGLNALFEEREILNYWDSGVRREKPPFGLGCSYDEADWDRYDSILAGNESDMRVIHCQEDARFAFANLPEGQHDGLHILSPDSTRIRSVDDDANDASYVILYRSPGGKILMPGDAHDETWDFVLREHREEVADCSILVAPHHGRDSDMDFCFLKVVNPKLVLMGCANSEHLAYDKYRDYSTLTNNQAGNVVVETNHIGGLDVFIENEAFAKASNRDLQIRNSQDYVFYCRL